MNVKLGQLKKIRYLYVIFLEIFLLNILSIYF